MMYTIVVYTSTVPYLVDRGGRGGGVVRLCSDIPCNKTLYINPRRDTCATYTHVFLVIIIHMSYFAYACKTEGKNGISHLISGLCINCLSSIPEYSRLNHLDVYLV